MGIDQVFLDRFLAAYSERYPGQPGQEVEACWQRFLKLCAKDPYTPEHQLLIQQWKSSPSVRNWVDMVVQTCRQQDSEFNLALQERLAVHFQLAAATLKTEGKLPPSNASRTIQTSLIHTGVPQPRIEGAVSSPIFCSANFESKGETSYEDLGYLRLNKSPNHLELHEKLRDIEKAEAALVTASGMAAISAALMCQLQPGDHILVQDGVYGGTYTFLTEDLERWGVNYTFVDAGAPESWAAHLRSATRIFYTEAISNPLTRVPDLTQVVTFCRQNGLVSVIDSTFATPVNFQPVSIGFDLVVHSATKYLNGHSDVLAGAVVGSSELVRKALHLQTHLGATLDPHACFLLNRGLKTLSLRVKQQNSNALKLAKVLEAHPQVERVYYPGLASHPDHHLAKALFEGYGGMLSFEAKADVADFFKRLTLPIVAPSLGGVETLVTRPAHTSHAGMTAAERSEIGISDNLVRVSVGIEDIDELVEDFLGALSGRAPGLLP